MSIRVLLNQTKGIARIYWSELSEEKFQDDIYEMNNILINSEICFLVLSIHLFYVFNLYKIRDRK